MNDPVKNYRAVRAFLLLQSLTVSVLVAHLRNYLDIPENGHEIKESKSKEIEKLLPKKNVFDFMGFKTEAYQSENHSTLIEEIGEKRLGSVDVIADALFIDSSIFRHYVLYNIILDHAALADNIRLISSREDSLREPGIYLKIDPFTSGEELLQIFNHTKVFRENFFEKVYGVKTRRKSSGQNPEKDIQEYLKIESKIKEYNKEKHQYSTEITDETYSRVISNAVNELAGEDIPEEDEGYEQELEKKAKQLTTLYYDVTDRYSIPTFRKLYSFLRLIPTK